MVYCKKEFIEKKQPWQYVFNKLVTNIHNEHETSFHKPRCIVTSILIMNICREDLDFLDLFPNSNPFSLKALHKTNCHIQSVCAS